MTWIPLFAAGIIYYLVNSGLVSSAIALSSGASFWRSWRDNYGYGFELWCTLAQISLAGFVLVAYQQMGPLAVFLLLPVLGVLWWSSAREAQARSTSTTDETGEPECGPVAFRPASNRIPGPVSSMRKGGAACRSWTSPFPTPRVWICRDSRPAL
jgi:hypothetical protein